MEKWLQNHFMGADQKGKRIVSARASYHIEFRPAARKQFEKLPLIDRKRIAAVIDALAVNPRPRLSIKMAGNEDNTYRIRVGDFRIIYNVSDDILLILVIKIGHRKDVYR